MLTQQTSLQKEIEKMRIEVQKKEPMMRTSQMNHVRIGFNFYDKIKEAQQKDDHIANNIEKVQRGETQDFFH